MRWIARGTVALMAASIAFFVGHEAAADQFGGIEDSLAGNRDAPEGEEVDEARHHFAKGKERFESGDYREAADHFRRAYDLTHAPELLYNLGRCHEELDEAGKAVESYELYLRMSPEAEDGDEVRDRIEALSEGSEEADEKDEKKPEEGRGIPAGVRLQIDMGLSVPLVGEWDRKAIPVDFQFHFPLAGWLYIGAGLLFGGFAGEDSTLNGYPRSDFGLYVALIGAWNLSGRLTMLARIGFAPTWVFRTDQHENAIWLDAQGGLGLAIRLVGAWALTAEVIGGFGPVFVPKARNSDPWRNDGISPTADIGGRLGVLYTF